MDYIIQSSCSDTMDSIIIYHFGDVYSTVFQVKCFERKQEWKLSVKL